MTRSLALALVLAGVVLLAGQPRNLFTQVGAAVRLQSDLYAADCRGDIHRIDSATSEIRLIGNSGVGGVIGLAVHPTSHVLYGVTSDTCGSPPSGLGRGRLVTIDKSTGVGAPVSDAQAGLEPNDSVVDLTFIEDGTLYGVIASASGPILITINVTTGIGSRIGSLPSEPAAGGIAALGAALYYSGGSDGMLWALGSEAQALHSTPLGDLTPISAMAFGCDGRLYASRSPTAGGGLETIDIATGAVSIVQEGGAFDAIAFECREDDTDGDGIADGSDICPLVANSDQRDTDADGQGDACDPDDDNDGVPDTTDNCALTLNADQQDTDGDRIGDACDIDDDADGVPDGTDNCSLTANANQLDTDADHIGDTCDLDADNDGLLNAVDNCPIVSNTNQLDIDADGFGNVCDPDGDSAIPVDAFITMNGSSVGTAVNSTVMRNGTLGFTGGTWAINDSAVALSVGPGRFNLPSPVRVGTAVYPVAYQTQSLAYDTFYNFNTMQANFPDNNIAAVSTGGFITFGIPDRGDSGSLSDLVRINLSSGAFAVFQLFNGNAPGDQYAVNIETDANGTVHSAFITVTPGASYWYTLKADFGAGRAFLNLYDATSFELVGAVTALTKKGNEISFIRYGNSEVAKSTDHTHFNYFEDSLIDWTRATFPLGPRPPAPDVTAPSVPTNLIASAASNSQVNLSWTLSSDNVGVAGYRIFRDGVHVALTTSVASYTDTGLVGLTSYSYTVSAYDFAGNASAQSFPPTLVTTPDVPFDFTLSHGGNKSVARGTQVANAITATRTSGVSVPVTFSATGLPSGATASFAPTSCSPGCTTLMTINTLSSTPTGNKTVTVKASAGSTTRTTSFTLTVTAAVDMAAPTIVLSDPVNGALLPVGTKTLRASASDNVGVVGVQFLVDGVPVNAEDTTSPYSTTWNVAAADAGPHVVAARARDAAGNTATSPAVNVTVDVQAPTGSMSINAGAVATNSRSVNLTLAATDDSGSVSQMRFSNASTGFSTPEPYAAAKAWTLSSGAGTKNVYVQFKDSAGNWSTSLVDSIELDTTAPTISDVTTSGLTSSGATVTWRTSENATSQVEFGLTTAYGQITTAGPVLLTSHSVTLANLAPRTKYYYRVRSRDAAGNEKIGSGKTFTTPF